MLRSIYKKRKKQASWLKNEKKIMKNELLKSLKRRESKTGGT